MKTKFKDLLDGDHTKFIVNSKILDLGRSAEMISNLAQKMIKEDGKHTKIHCSNIVDWMDDITKQAQKILDLRISGEKE